MLETTKALINISGILIFINLVVFALGGALIWGLLTKKTQSLEARNKRLTALKQLDEVMMSSFTSLSDVSQKVTDAVAFNLGFMVGVLALVDTERDILKRVAMSQTREGKKAMSILPIHYTKIEIPLNYKGNLMVKAVEEGRVQITTNLFDVFTPVFNEDLSREIQATVRVKTSFIYPVVARGKKIGAMIFSTDKLPFQISDYDKETMQALVDVVGIALNNATLYQNLERATKELSLANEKLKEMDKLKDDFVSIASHELRTPMTAIRSYAWMALYRSDMPLSEKMKKYLSRTLISTERLINLVNDMLNISRIESGSVQIRPIAFDIQSLVKDVCLEVFVKAREEKLHLRVLETHVPKVFADPDKVHQVLLNLIGNAMKFTPDDGSVTVSFFSDGESVEVSIKDTGVGISREDMPRLFQKFGRLDNSYVAAATSGGTGLGLYISKILVNLMQGKIWVDSEGKNKGTTFSFSLPAATPKNLEHPEKYTRKVEGEAKQLEPAVV